jgi:hypothetical protein
MTKNQFLNSFKEIIKKYKARKIKKVSYASYDFEVSTTGGYFQFTNVESSVQTVYSIFGRFKNPKQAYNFFHCNPYNGKYNFHIKGRAELLIAFSNFLKRGVINDR